MQVSRALLVPTGLSNVSLELTAERAQETPARSTDNSPWLADYKRANTLIPSSLLPEKQTTLFYTRAYRYSRTAACCNQVKDHVTELRCHCTVLCNQHVPALIDGCWVQLE